jgi:hypothetical protein
MLRPARNHYTNHWRSGRLATSAAVDNTRRLVRAPNLLWTWTLPGRGIRQAKFQGLEVGRGGFEPSSADYERLTCRAARASTQAQDVLSAAECRLVLRSFGTSLGPLSIGYSVLRAAMRPSGSRPMFDNGVPHGLAICRDSVRVLESHCLCFLT